MSMTLEELAELIRETSEEINTVKVYWVLKAYGVKKFQEATVKLTQLCLACKKVGVPITSRLMSAMQERGLSSICENLHRLGDQHVSYEYMVHPTFAKLFNGETKERAKQ